MGKNKGQGQAKKSQGSKRAFKKDPVATKVAVGVKKTKTKPVVSNLKRMTFQAKAKTEDVDAQFAEIQHQTLAKKRDRSDVSAAARAEAEKTLQPDSSKRKTKKAEEEEPDVDMATEELSKLGS